MKLLSRNHKLNVDISQKTFLFNIFMKLLNLQFFTFSSNGITIFISNCYYILSNKTQIQFVFLIFHQIQVHVFIFAAKWVI